MTDCINGGTTQKAKYMNILMRYALLEPLTECHALVALFNRLDQPTREGKEATHWSDFVPLLQTPRANYQHLRERSN